MNERIKHFAESLRRVNEHNDMSKLMNDVLDYMETLEPNSPERVYANSLFEAAGWMAFTEEKRLALISTTRSVS